MISPGNGKQSPASAVEKGGSGLGLRPCQQAGCRASHSCPPRQGFPPTLRCFPGCRGAPAHPAATLHQPQFGVGSNPGWGEGRGPNRAARLAACSGGIFLHQKPKSPVPYLFSSPSHGPTSLPYPTVVPKGFLLLAVPAPQPSTSPICITSRQHWLERQECKQALGSTVSMHVTTILAAAGDTAPALGSALQHPRTQPCRVEVTLTFPLGAMASQAGNHWSEGKEELWKGTEKST